MLVTNATPPPPPMSPQQSGRSSASPARHRLLLLIPAHLQAPPFSKPLPYFKNAHIYPHATLQQTKSKNQSEIMAASRRGQSKTQLIQTRKPAPRHLSCCGRWLVPPPSPLFPPQFLPPWSPPQQEAKLCLYAKN